MVSKIIPIFANKSFSLCLKYSGFLDFHFSSIAANTSHVHVEGNDGYAIYDLVGTSFVLREKQNIKANDLKKIESIIEQNKDIIIKRWKDHFKGNMELSKLSFDNDFIYAQDETGRTHKQSLLWYPALKSATDEQKHNYTVGLSGFHRRDLDEDISFESFTYEDVVPSAFQEFFLIHKEINVSEFAKRIGINATLMRNYINGFKKPSKIREQEIINAIHKIGEEYVSSCIA